MPSTTNMNVRYSTPPPTYHNLDSIQRAHLMRSTKKISQILGTTPYLLDTTHHPITLLPIGPRSHSPSPSTRSTASSDSDKSTKSSRRMGSIFTHYQASIISSSVTYPALQSSSSVNLLSEKHSPHRPHPLVLHLNPVSLSPSDPRVTSFSLTPTPTSGVFTPSAPTFNVSLQEKQNAEARRRKMARVTRILGQNVPPELVFPTQSRSEVPSNSGKRIRRSMSVSGVYPQASFAPTRCSWIGEWNRKDIRDVQRQLRDLKAR